MTTIGMRIDENGTLTRDGGAFYLRRDLGGRYQLELQRLPVDLVEKRVRLVGNPGCRQRRRCGRSSACLIAVSPRGAPVTMTHKRSLNRFDALPESGRWLRFRSESEIVALIVGGKQQFGNPTSRR